MSNIDFREMYRMTYPDFKKLCDIVTPHINHAICSNTIRGWTPNDRKTIEVRVACAIRHFAGDLDGGNRFIYGVSQIFFNESADLLVAALMENDCPELRGDYKRLFVVTGLNPKSKAKLYTPILTYDSPKLYCFEES
jgi:hypothetical protein